MNEKIGCLECLKHAFMKCWSSPVCVTDNGRFANIYVDTISLTNDILDYSLLGGGNITKIDKYTYITLMIMDSI